ncbi:hypothetical protein [Paraburkholderia sp. C35]|uniref:hypothetical protein n=1 Tax=Paraburkholderia sp. C35 TaxID=2126993 RepID=UPI000D69419C|nr:hypothetical protein [Paraburkholderia sp. C35]
MRRSIIFPAILIATIPAFMANRDLTTHASHWLAALSPVGEAYAATETTKLGDLSKFRVIVVDTSKLVDANDLAGAKKRIKDLETSWDDAEPALKPRAAADWHKLDKSIDSALEALRESAPNQSKCRQTLTQLLSMMDGMSGKA